MRPCTWLVIIVALLAIACGGASQPSPAASPRAAAPPQAPAAATTGQPAGQAAPAAAAKPAVAGAAASAPQTAPPPLDPPVKVRYGTLQLAAEAATYIAVDKGYFRAEGLELEFTPFRSGSEMTPLLATGALDMGGAGLDPGYFNAAQRGIDIKLVSHSSLVTPNDESAGLVVRKDHLESGRFTELKDLAGMVIANNGSTLSQLWMARIVERAGLQLSDVTLTTVPFPDQVPALANRAVDAAWTVEPFVTLGEAQGVAKRVIPMGDVYPGIVTTVLMMGPQFAADQPEAARRFLVAHLQGLRYYYHAFVKNDRPADRAEIFEILTRYTPTKDASRYAALGMHGVEPNGELSERMLQEVEQTFQAMGAIQEPVDVSKIVDRSYVDYALERLGREPD
jgi:NitT/TauT family transport system substrate-binding protein